MAEVLTVITGKDRAALLASDHLALPMTFESVDIADLHVITGALAGSAHQLCSSDGRTLGYDPVGSLRIVHPVALADELDLIDRTAPAPTS